MENNIINHKLSVLILFIILFSKSIFSQEDRWVLVSNEENPSRSFYYDSKSIEIDGNTITFWEKWIFWGSNCDESYVLAEMKCGKRQYRWTKQINICNGKKNTVDLTNTTWDVIEPESITEKYYFILCK